MMSDEPDVIEGKWSDRLVVMKFPDGEKARALHDSPDTRCPDDASIILTADTYTSVLPDLARATADAVAADPDGRPDTPGPTAAPLQRTCDGLLEASVPEQFKDASSSLAVDWTDLESFSRPPPHGTSDCADPRRRTRARYQTRR